MLIFRSCFNPVFNMSSIHHATPEQHIHAKTESKGPEHHVYQFASQGSISGQTKSASGTVGWWTPLIIVGTFLAAVLIAIIHYVYCRILDKKPVGSTIPQSWNTALSVTFAHLFATALTASASTAFTQLLWWYLRRRSLSISKIDALFSLNCSSSNLYQLGILKTTPVLWFFGLLVPLISVATIFPPGSLVVQQLPKIYKETTGMHTLDIDNRGDGSAADFLAYALFELGVDGEYLYVWSRLTRLNCSYLIDCGSQPDRIFTKIAKRTIREGMYDTA